MIWNKLSCVFSIEHSEMSVLFLSLVTLICSHLAAIRRTPTQTTTLKMTYDINKNSKVKWVFGYATPTNESASKFTWASQSCILSKISFLILFRFWYLKTVVKISYTLYMCNSINKLKWILIYSGLQGEYEEILSLAKHSDHDHHGDWKCNKVKHLN